MDLSKNLKCSGGRAKCYSVCVCVPDILGAIEIYDEDGLVNGACLINVTVNCSEIVDCP